MNTTTNTPDVIFVSPFVPDPDALFHTILTTTQWDDRMTARRTATFGVPYNYSGMTYPETPMPAHLGAVAVLIGNRLGFLPNNCLINNYVDGRSTIGFHADSIAGLAAGTGVAIISLGCTRALSFRRIRDRTVTSDWLLPHGSMLYMPPEVQMEWLHGIRKQPEASQRVSLTFRLVRPASI